MLLKTGISLFLTLVALQALAEAFSPLNYPSSVHSAFHQQEARNRMTAELKRVSSEACVNAIKDALKNGFSFQSETVLEHSAPVQSVPELKLTTLETYHWSNAGDALKGIAASGNFEDLFGHLRGLACTNEFYRSLNCGSWPWYLYVAADKKTADNYGRHLFKVMLSPRSLVFFARGDKPGKRIQPVKLRDAIEKELSDREPKLEACLRKNFRSDASIKSLAPNETTFHLSPLVVMALEASEISAVAHVGINNSSSFYLGRRPAQWLQLLGPWAIESMSFLHSK